MNCLELREILPMYADGVLNEAENAACEKHLAECPLCRQELDNLLQVSRLFREMPEVSLPDDFEIALHRRLLAEEALKTAEEPIVVPLHSTKHPSRRKYFATRWLGGALAACLLLMVGVGALNFSSLPGGEGAAIPAPASSRSAALPAPQSAAYNGESNQQDIAAMESAPDMALAPMAGANGGLQEENAAKVAYEGQPKKIIYDTYLTIDVDTVTSVVEQSATIAEKYKGYVLNSSVFQDKEGREQEGNVIVRVPLAAYDDAVAEYRTLGQLRENSKNGNDVTLEYYDVQARLKQYKAQETRYLELLKQADNVSEILEVETQLNEVRVMIESLQSNLETLTRLTDYGTIHLSFTVSSVKKSGVSFGSWEGIGSQIVGAFTTSVNAVIYGGSRIVVFLVYGLPVLATFLALALIFIWIVNRRKKKKKQ